MNIEDHLLHEYISSSPDAKTVVLFGGSPYRRDEVIRMMMKLKRVSIYGTLSEEEGIQKLQALKNVDLILIGGRYSNEQRIRIRNYAKENLPATSITEPGFDYPYENGSILNEVTRKLSI